MWNGYPLFFCNFCFSFWQKEIQHDLFLHFQIPTFTASGLNKCSQIFFPAIFFIFVILLVLVIHFGIGISEKLRRWMYQSWGFGHSCCAAPPGFKLFVLLIFARWNFAQNPYTQKELLKLFGSLLFHII